MSPSRDAARRGILRVDAHRLAPVDLRGLAGGAEIELAVQPGRRLVGDQLQREARGGGRSGAVDRRQPGRDAPGSRHSRSRRSSPRRSRSCRSASATARPAGSRRKARTMPPSHGRVGSISSPSSQNCVEIGRVDAALRQGAAGRLVDVLEPLPRRAALGKCLGKAEALGQPGKDRRDRRAPRR